MKSVFSPRTLITALALALGVAATASAASPDSERGNHCDRGGKMAHGMSYGVQGMSRLHGDLKLDARQEALWQAAEKAGGEGRDGRREAMRKQHAATRALLDQPGADLRAVLKQMDEARAEAHRQNEARRDRWLAVYDTLNPEQKEKARIFFKNRLAHSGHLPGMARGRAGRE
ncbi:MAG: periplasmic heavy metal sensor [Rhodocyclaceae bacterium]